MEANGKKILLAFDGGIDSAVAASILKVQGFDVVAVHVRVWIQDEINIKYPDVPYNCAGIEKDLNVDLNLTHNPNKLELHEEKLPPIEDLLALDHKQFTDLVTNADKFPRISSKTKENPLEEFAKDEKEDSFLNNLLNLILSMILGMVIGGGILFFILNKLKFSFSSF